MLVLQLSESLVPTHTHTHASSNIYYALFALAVVTRHYSEGGLEINNIAAVSRESYQLILVYVVAMGV